jgi:hypothetical protein
MKVTTVAGSKIKSYCEHCSKIVEATYSYGSFAFDTGLVADEVLRALCNTCQNVVAVAQQAAATLKEAMDSQDKRSTMRIPKDLLDFISMQLTLAGARPKNYELFLRAMLASCHGKEDELGGLLRLLNDPVLKQPNTEVLNIAFNSYLRTVIDALSRASGIGNTSDLLRRLIVLTRDPAVAKSVAAETSRLLMVCS